VSALGKLILSLGVLAAATHASAQTAPLPAPMVGDVEPGFLTRGDWLLSVAPMASGDPVFAWSVRQQYDIDLARFPRGRVNLFFDNEVVMGRERREFDFNHGNIMFETSATARIGGGINASFVFHHVSRHLIDRPVSRVVAWHTVVGRIDRPFTAGRATVTPTMEFQKVVQHTYVDYTWLNQFALRVDLPFPNGVRLFANGSGGMVGVDPDVLDDFGRPLNRNRQAGGRADAGVHIPGRKAALELYAAYERRIDGYPLARVPSSWFEAGFRLASP
jgi:hypothetical protein